MKNVFILTVIMFIITVIMFIPKSDKQLLESIEKKQTEFITGVKSEQNFTEEEFELITEKGMFIQMKSERQLQKEWLEKQERQKRMNRKFIQKPINENFK